MRKPISLIIIFMMIFTSFSVHVYAAEEKAAVSDTIQMEQLAELVKTKFNIPDDYQDFTSSFDTYDKGKTYRFNWSTPSYITNTRGSLEVVVDTVGNVRSYNHYQQTGDYEYRRKLPSFDKTQALVQAKKFIYFIAPDILDELSLDTEHMMCTIAFDGSYMFNFFRTYQGIPFYDNFISLTLDGKTGEVVNFYRSWTEGLKFPEPKGILKPELAEKAYKEQIGLQLGYKRTYNEDYPRTYLAYAPGAIQDRSAIQAFSGTKVTEGEGNQFYSDQLYRLQAYRRDPGEIYGEQVLAKTDLEKLRTEANFLSVETAEKLARGMTELGLNEKCSMQRSMYTRSSGNGTYNLRLEFAIPAASGNIGKDISEEKLKEMAAAGDGGGSANVIFNAATGELVQYEAYYYGNKGNKEQLSLTREELQKRAEDFLKKYKKEKAAETRRMEGAGSNSLYDIKYGMLMGGSTGSFIYVRTVGGLPFEDNRLELTLDPLTGNILNYHELWDGISFVSADGVIGLDKAYNVLFKMNPLKLKYITTVGDIPEIQLVYAPDFRKSVNIEAQRGILINPYDDHPFIADNAVKYRDIKGYKLEKEITVLSEIGILPPGDTFRPEDVILQKEFLYMISKIKYDNYGFNLGTGQMGQKEMDAMYRVLMNDNVLEEAEKNPDGIVTRQQGVGFFLKALGYKKLAEIEGIFYTDYQDKKDIDPKLAGYVAIARGLKLIDAQGRFSPKAGLTRAEAAKMVYNGLIQ